jgi:NADH-quinone oxidoreductase subunit G
MSEELVTLTIDGIEVSVPKGTMIVDAAKKVGIEIPVFCYHPKMHPVGMCRMCLVEVGRPAWDRTKNEPVLDEDGKPVIQFGPNLETSCSTPVGEGWVVRVNSEKATQGRKEVVEYLLTSHPLDCPICDKGGECALQNLAMEHGPGKSRFLFDEKMHLDKHVPLGELIFLDRERCIQCSRCVRFQEEIVGDPVIGFSERGRKLEIITFSNPGFDSYFSGNTTDICPVGALTTADFRFGARPWEMKAAASICTHCPVGCNLMLNTRREASQGGKEVVKRVMPRQNEHVNEIWICDKGRFGHHFAGSEERLRRPLVRRNGELVESSWEEALTHAAEGIKAATGQDSTGLIGIAGGRASNEDLFVFRRVMEGLDGQAILDETLAGGDVVQKVGVGSEVDLGKLGAGDAVLVIASDLHEEAPIWWLRVKQAVDRGATLVVANARPTRLEGYATHLLRYAYGEAVGTGLALLHAATGQKDLAKYAGGEALSEAANALTDADNLVIFYGGDGLDYTASEKLAQALGSLLAAGGKAGLSQSGLIAVWPRSNSQGAWDMGVRPAVEGVRSELEGASSVYVMASDPLGDDPGLAEVLEDKFVIVQELFRTPTADIADVVFPAQSFIEREGTFTNGERRVQRYYPAVAAYGESLPDWRILAALAKAMGVEIAAGSAASIMLQISQDVPDYAGLTYQALAEAEDQWPHVGGDDLFFGGTAYANTQGVGVKLASTAERGQPYEIQWTAPGQQPSSEGLLLVPVTQLYDEGTTLIPSKVLHTRLSKLQVFLSPGDADRIGVSEGGTVEISWDGRAERIPVKAQEDVPEGVVLLPRSLGVAITTPQEAVQVKIIE